MLCDVLCLKRQFSIAFLLLIFSRGDRNISVIPTPAFLHFTCAAAVVTEATPPLPITSQTPNDCSCTSSLRCFWCCILPTPGIPSSCPTYALLPHPVRSYVHVLRLMTPDECIDGCMDRTIVPTELPHPQQVEAARNGKGPISDKDPLQPRGNGS